ncbi:HesB/IscA family protein [Thermomonas paludicola]|jgi:iron-sulfur cluster assembly protein|uniref:HesB/IscA family protein n=1 Tax=Thermomonas paludicola TaxID=2884874 RepID=UPI002113C1FC|nr:iron-sulfur cluster assembly accessory protein [Thermomonas paludicola]
MSIHLTESARARILGFLELDTTALGLRFGVSRSGCSGWGYKVEVAHERRPDDAVFDDGGVHIFVDAASLAQVDGTRIDYVQQGLNAQFVFSNPNVTGGCGCGSSFTTDAERIIEL